MNSGKKLKILFVSSECAGLVKTGGLGDVVFSLSKALYQKGHDVRVIIPYYSALLNVFSKKIIESIFIQPGNRAVGCAVLETKLAGVPVYLLQHDDYFGRQGLYDDGQQEYADNPERFALLSKASLDVAAHIGFYPDWVHAHDWQTALVSLYLTRVVAKNRRFKNTKSLLTIHNGFFQGRFGEHCRGFIGLEEAYNSKEFEDHGNVNLLKGGIHFANQVSTVSPGYAKELLTPEGGHGLHLKYQQKGGKFAGILNGCDTETWNPKTDTFIKANYSSTRLANKKKCKQDILQIFGINYNPKRPLIGIVSRLTEQKGFHYTIPALIGILKEDVSILAIGAGNSGYAQGLDYLRYLYPEKFNWYHGYNEAIAHKIEAGADLFLMPSLFEPCGLNQMYSQIYGTIPVVRSVGGLQDTVKNFDESNDQGTGFVFYQSSSEAVYYTVKWALEIFNTQKKQFAKMQKRAMLLDYSWSSSVLEYEKIYNQV